MTSKQIEEILARRGDLSTFLVHLISSQNSSKKELTKEELQEALTSIIENNQIESRNPWGMLKQYHEDPNLIDSIKEKQKCVCFSETPLEFIWSLCEDIPGRNCPLSNFGIIITKKEARNQGVNPVWYIDGTEGHGGLDKKINKLIQDAINKKDEQEKNELFELTPFFEVMNSWKDKDSGQTKRKEFWWEREWRHKGPFKLPEDFITICPQEDHKHIESIITKKGKSAHLIDPRWSMEQMIANLAKFNPDEIGPF